MENSIRRNHENWWPSFDDENERQRSYNPLARTLSLRYGDKKTARPVISRQDPTDWLAT